MNVKHKICGIYRNVLFLVVYALNLYNYYRLIVYYFVLQYFPGGNSVKELNNSPPKRHRQHLLVLEKKIPAPIVSA